jgi:hypothetical protein
MVAWASLNVPVQLSMSWRRCGQIPAILAGVVGKLYRIDLSEKWDATWEVRDTPPDSLFTVLLAFVDHLVWAGPRQFVVETVAVAAKTGGKLEDDAPHTESVPPSNRPSHQTTPIRARTPQSRRGGLLTLVPAAEMKSSIRWTWIRITCVSLTGTLAPVSLAAGTSIFASETMRCF